MDSFGKRLKYAKENKGLTNSDLAKLMGKKSQSTIVAWENGSSEVTLSQLKQLAEILDVSEEFLLKGSIDDDTISAPNGYIIVDAAKYSRLLEELNEKKDQIINEQSNQISQLKNIEGLDRAE